MQELKESSPRRDDFGKSNAGVLSDFGDAFVSSPSPAVAQERVEGGGLEGQVNALLLLLLFSRCLSSIISSIFVFFFAGQ